MPTAASVFFNTSAKATCYESFLERSTLPMKKLIILAPVLALLAMTLLSSCASQPTETTTTTTQETVTQPTTTHTTIEQPAPPPTRY